MTRKPCRSQLWVPECACSWSALHGPAYAQTLAACAWSCARALSEQKPWEPWCCTQQGYMFSSRMRRQAGRQCQRLGALLRGDVGAGRRAQD